MKTLKLKKFFLWMTILALALIACATLAVGLNGNTNTDVAVAADGPKIVLKCNPEQIPATDMYQEFTITARIEGVSSVPIGLYAGNVRITPVEKESLIFVGFIASTDVMQSVEMESSPGEYVGMEGGNNGLSAIKTDFNVGSYKFKLKTGENPGTLNFAYEDIASADWNGDPLSMESGTFTVQFRTPQSDNTLSALSISAGGKEIVNGVQDDFTVEDTISYADRELKMSANRVGDLSKIKVVDSVNNKTLVVETTKDLKDVSLGKLDPGEHTLTITVTSEAGEAKNYTVKLNVGLEALNSLTGLTITANGKTVLEGVDDEQSVENGIYYSDREIRITALREGAFSKIKVVDTTTDKTLIADTEGDLKNQFCGKLDLGDHRLEITVTSQSGESKTYVVNLTIVDDPLADDLIIKKPSTQPGTPSNNSYTGSPIDFTPSGLSDIANKLNFEKVNPDGTRSPATLNDFKPTNAGNYTIVATPKDGFFWEDGGTDPIEYSFEVEKATLKATSGGEGKLPNFSSDSYKGSLNDVIEYQYFTDEECTQPIAKSDLVPGETYYAKPVLKDGADANFQFGDDATTQKFVNEGCAYLEPAKTPVAAKENFFTKKLLGLPVWAWLILLLVIILLIVLLVLFLVKKKKKDEEARNGGAFGAGVAAGAAADSALSSRTEKLDDRLRAMEDKAHEREITRYRDEVEGARRGDPKTEKLDDRLRAMEDKAHEREIARYKEEVEKAKRDAELKASAAATGVAASAAADSAMAMKTEKLEERIREMEREARDREREIEREAYEREIERYKEEIAKAKKDAELRAATPGAVGGAQSDASNLRIAQLEDELRRYQERMRDEMRRRDDEQRAVERRSTEERIAQMKLEAEREVERIREEARRNSGAFNQPQAATLATTEMIARLTQLEENMKRREESMREEMRRQQDAQRENERKAAEERIAQMKAEAEREVERLKQEARETAKAMHQPQAAVLASNEMAARFAQLEESFKRREEEMRNEMRRQEEIQRENERKNAEARIAQMKADAEREAMRIKEEAEHLKEEARKAAEDIKRQSEIAANRQPIVASGLHIKTEGDMDAETAAVLREYHDRMRKMEQELQEQRMTNLMRENTEKARKEMEEANKMRRHEEEMQRLREMQDYERRQRQEMQNMQSMPFMQPYMQQQMFGGGSDAYMRQQQDLEAQRLRLLEERLKQREMEVQMLRTQGFAAPQQQPFAPYGQPGYAQPGFVPVQPGYAPGYAPVQPGYVPIQPNPNSPLGDK